MKKITTRQDDYPQWYLDVIAAADMADNSPVRGCMVIKPYGYAIWEMIQKVLDAKFKEKNVKNAYFPLFIPKSFLEKEAKHVEGFAKECAVVTHHRLEEGKDGHLVPAGELEEPLIVRPTSETIMYDTFARWIQSHRDLPLLINQWANVVRWEMRTRPFLRTTEFLWQEGHTVHVTAEEADSFAREMLDVYSDFAASYLAMPVISGYKSESERFPGAENTYCIEAMMQDGKALQAGTSHFLGDNFAKAFGIKFLSEANKEEYGWQTSWGVSTRIIGGLIMTHSDDQGLVLPPRIAPVQAVLIPVWNSEEEKAPIWEFTDKISSELEKAGVRLETDRRDGRPGPKFFEWEKKGVPVRIEVGPKEMMADSVVLARRDTGGKETVGRDRVVETVTKLLVDIQDNLYKRAVEFRDQNTVSVDTWEEFEKTIEDGKFVMAHWDGTAETEALIKEKTKATIRCVSLDQKEEKGKCVYSGGESNKRVVFARAY